MIPYNRIEEHFLIQMQIPVSAGSIVNFNKEAYERLAFIDNRLKEQLSFSALVHVDETGINTGGIRSWLHKVAMDDAKIFCRIHSYLSTCRKHGLTASEALSLLFQRKWPPFMSSAAPIMDAE